MDFVDIDPSTGLMCINALSAKLVQAERDGCLPKVLVPVHLCGTSCDMEAIGALSQSMVLVSWRMLAMRSVVIIKVSLLVVADIALSQCLVFIR